MKVRFRSGTHQQYKAITPDNYTFYYVTDIDALYLGSIRLPNVYIRTTQEWNQNPNFIGQPGVLYVYSDYIEKTISHQGEPLKTQLIPGIKVGDGQAYLIDAPFINDRNFYISDSDRAKWDNKISFPNDSRTYSVGQDQRLVFTVD